MSRAFAFRLPKEAAEKLERKLLAAGLSLKEWILLSLEVEVDTRPAPGSAPSGPPTPAPAVQTARPSILDLANVILDRILDERSRSGPAVLAGQAEGEPRAEDSAGRSADGLLALALDLLRRGPRRGLTRRRSVP